MSMSKDYSVVSPSLEGVLSHDCVSYEGVRRPAELLRAMDAPSRGLRLRPKPGQKEILQSYFYDLYGVFMKRLSHFVLACEAEENETVAIQAMLQELVKVKRLLGS